MSQEKVLEIIKKYSNGALFSDIEKEFKSPGSSITLLYKNRLIKRKPEKGGFRYYSVEENI